MAVFTIQTPDGRELDIEAADEATALRGAQEWVAANPKGTAPSQPPSAASMSPQDQLNAEIRRTLGMGQQPAPKPDNSANPMATSIPNVGLGIGGFNINLPFGDMANSLRAATRGAQDTSMLNMSDEAWAGAAGLPQVAANAIQGQGMDFAPVADEYNASNTMRQQTQQLDPGAYDVGSMAGVLALGGKAKTAPSVGAIPSPLRTGATAATYGGAAGFGAGETMEERLKGGAVGAGTGAVLGYGMGKLLAPSKAAIPSVKSLGTESKAAFDAARSTGATVQPAATKTFADDVRRLLDGEGVISPSGKVADFPRVGHALNVIDDYAGQTMTIEQAMKVRKSLRRAAGAIDPEERFIGVKMLNAFDDFIEQNGGAAAAPWAAGRSTYHTMMKGRSVENLIGNANRKKFKFSGSGQENAIRNQFDAFVGKDKNLRGFTPDERTALERVAKGTGVGNTARAVGKLAPTGVVSAGLSGGVPFMIGNAVGGPVAGGMAAAGSLTLGTIGRFVATLSTKHQAELARVLVLSGGRLPSKIPPGVSKEVSRVLGNMLLMGGASAPEVGQSVLQLLRSQSQQQNTARRPAA